MLRKPFSVCMHQTPTQRKHMYLVDDVYVFLFSCLNSYELWNTKRSATHAHFLRKYKKKNITNIGINRADPKRQTWNWAAGARNDFPEPCPVKCTAYHLYGTSGLRSRSHSINAAHITVLCSSLFWFHFRMHHTCCIQWKNVAKAADAATYDFSWTAKRSCYWSNDYTQLLHAPLSTTRRPYFLVPCILHIT